MVVLPDPESDDWPFFKSVYLGQDSLSHSHDSHHRRSRDETLKLWRYGLPLDSQKDQFKFVLFLQRLMTMVEEHYRNRHKSKNWKVSKPIEDWYHQSIRDLSKLGIDESNMNSKWQKVVQKGYRKAAEKEQKAALKVHLETMEEEKGYHHHRHRDRRRGGRRKSYYEPFDCSCDDKSSDSTDSCSCKSKTSKSISPTKEKEKEKEKEKDLKRTSGWEICWYSPKNCHLEHKRVNCKGLCGLTACLGKEHRMHKTYSEIECTEPNCKRCKRAKEKKEELEKEKNPAYQEKKVDCPCGYPNCKHKVFEIEESPKPPKPRYFSNK